MTDVRTALVIGGGIAGPVTATALRMAGVEATVHERYETTADGAGGTLALAPNGVAALRIVGAAEAVTGIATPITRQVMSVGGRRFGLPVPAGLPPLRSVHRSDLYRVLYDRAVAAGVGFEYGKRLVGAEQTGDGVLARFADGSTASADILIGADGINSTVRRLVDPAAPARSTPVCWASRDWRVSRWRSIPAPSPSPSAGAATTSTGRSRAAAPAGE